MATQIRRFEPLQTAKVFALIYAIGALAISPIFLLIGIMAPGEFPGGAVFALILPAFYGVMGFVMVLIGSALYNFVAGHVGGVQVDLVDIATPPIT